ncbi:hypothetical protein BH18ACT16_BH18ACT16_01910 [soil metagenome]
MAVGPEKLMAADSTESNYLRLYVRQLRQKLGDTPSNPRWITTEPGLGYRWLPEIDAT